MLTPTFLTLMAVLRQTQLSPAFGLPPRRPAVRRIPPTPPPRLVQAVLSQFFYNLSMYGGDIGFTDHLNARQLKDNVLPGPRLSRDLPTFKINEPLPFPSPTTEVHRKANVQRVSYHAAAAARPMADYWGEQTLRASYLLPSCAASLTILTSVKQFMESCQEDPDFLSRHFEQAKVAFYASLGPRASDYLTFLYRFLPILPAADVVVHLVDLEAVEGGSLWLEVQHTGGVIHT